MAATGGVLQTLSLAPFELWWCLPLGLALWLVALKRDPVAGSFAYGLGLFGSGAHWIWVSMVTISATPLPIAVLLEVGFISVLAATFAVAGWLYRRLSPINPWLTFPALVVVTELLRTFAFTGFPWLFAGYGLMPSPWGHLGALVGVYGLSALAAVMAVALHHWRGWWALAPALAGMAWYSPTPPISTAEPVTVRLIQSSVPANEKWNPAWRDRIIERHLMPTLTADTDWVVWSENALPLLGAEADAYFDEMARQRPDLALFAGRLIEAEPDRTRRYYNAIDGVGAASGQHLKQRLVPFGEYVPLEGALRGLIDFFDLPLSTIVPGQGAQRLSAGGVTIGALICYEVAYPLLAWQGATDAQVLVSVSNDAWFGDSIARDQHLQMAQMRALELGLPMVRATNDGVTAVIDAQGRISARLENYAIGHLDDSFVPATTRTLYSLWGPWPVWGIAVALILANLVTASRRPTLPSKGRDR